MTPDDLRSLAWRFSHGYATASDVSRAAMVLVRHLHDPSLPISVVLRDAANEMEDVESEAVGDCAVSGSALFQGEPERASDSSIVEAPLAGTEAGDGSKSTGATSPAASTRGSHPRRRCGYHEGVA